MSDITTITAMIGQQEENEAASKPLDLQRFKALEKFVEAGVYGEDKKFLVELTQYYLQINSISSARRTALVYFKTLSEPGKRHRIAEALASLPNSQTLNIFNEIKNDNDNDKAEKILSLSKTAVVCLWFAQWNLWRIAGILSKVLFDTMMETLKISETFFKGPLYFVISRFCSSLGILWFLPRAFYRLTLAIKHAVQKDLSYFGKYAYYMINDFLWAGMNGLQFLAAFKLITGLHSAIVPGLGILTSVGVFLDLINTCVQSVLKRNKVKNALQYYLAKEMTDKEILQSLCKNTNEVAPTTDKDCLKYIVNHFHKFKADFLKDEDNMQNQQLLDVYKLGVLLRKRNSELRYNIAEGCAFLVIGFIAFANPWLIAVGVIGYLLVFAAKKLWLDYSYKDKRELHYTVEHRPVLLSKLKDIVEVFNKKHPANIMPSYTNDTVSVQTYIVQLLRECIELDNMQGVNPLDTEQNKKTAAQMYSKLRDVITLFQTQAIPYSIDIKADSFLNRLIERISSGITLGAYVANIPAANYDVALFNNNFSPPATRYNQRSDSI